VTQVDVKGAGEAELALSGAVSGFHQIATR
jgi:hypothetical protein